MTEQTEPSGSRVNTHSVTHAKWILKAVGAWISRIGWDPSQVFMLGEALAKMIDAHGSSQKLIAVDGEIKQLTYGYRIRNTIHDWYCEWRRNEGLGNSPVVGGPVPLPDMTGCNAPALCVRALCRSMRFLGGHDSDIPLLTCPECGVGLIPPSGRGLFTNEGEFQEHSETCRCPHCEWIWFDDTAPVTCECGALVVVACDDERAFATQVDD